MKVRFLFALFILLLMWGVLLASTPALAHTSEKPHLHKKYTEEQLAQIAKKREAKLQLLLKKYSKAELKKRAQLDGQLSKMLRRRKNELLKLMKKNPKLAKKRALSEGAKKKIPEKFKKYVEQKIALRGKVTIFHEDDFERKKSKDSCLLNIREEKKRLRLHLPKGNCENLRSVKLKGLRIDDDVLVEETQDDPESPPETAETTNRNLGEQKLAVILTRFPDVPLGDAFAPVSQELLNAAVFGEENSVNAFFRENSYGQTFFTGEVFDFVTVSQATDEYLALDPERDGAWWGYFIQDALDAASAAGIAVSQYDRFVFLPYLPPTVQLPGPLSRAVIGPASFSVAGEEREVTAATVYLPLNATEIPLNTFQTFIHELGHNFGGSHARSIFCPQPRRGQTDAEPCPAERIVENYLEPPPPLLLLEYGDEVDPMGSGFGHFSAYHKEKFGFLAAGSITTVSGGGDFWIDRLETSGAGTDGGIKELRVFSDDGFYSLEYRNPEGSAPFGAASGEEGVYLRFVPGRELDERKGGGIRYGPLIWPENGVLQNGQSQEDDFRGLTFRVTEMTESQAHVEINF